MTYTISALAKKFGLSRSTLLYYDSIGLLSPQRSGADYRVYTNKDVLLMEEIVRLRSAGIALREIKKVLQRKSSRRGDILRQRLQSINNEMRNLRQQQTFILGLLGDKEIIGLTRSLTKEKWVSYLRKAGLDEAGMERWHGEFEVSSPEAHQDFLESLGIPDDEISQIRARSRHIGKNTSPNEKS